MSSDLAIRVTALSKTYRIYDRPHDRLKQSIWGGKRRFFREFSALQDVSFDVMKGETLGIIGRNGSGKSTLLQMICGTLSPTAGDVEIHGRVSALLELGAGFNPEFTGRENVYMNASILGLTKEEIDSRYESIIDFADIGQFVHQPVKTYSSGMYVRLAFSIAVSVEPDILIVDEALSVGDEVFQRKCFSRIQSIQERGGTILFVSHSTSNIMLLCNRAIMLDRGELLLAGSPKQAVSLYRKLINAPKEKYESIRNDILHKENFSLTEDSEPDIDRASDDKSDISPTQRQKSFGQLAEHIPNMVPESTVNYESRGARITNPRILTNTGQEVNMLISGDEYLYTYDIFFDEDAFSVRYGMAIKITSGAELGGLVSHPKGKEIKSVKCKTIIHAQFRFRCLLQPGTYFLNSGVVGIVDESEIYLARSIDIGMFKVHEIEERCSTGVINFSV